jgi:phosphoribosylformimino-5-aminoimidazole carboxamide ribotide isomerase
MLILPAIDIRGGRCVRLVQGQPAAELHLADDPVEVASRWQKLGAHWLHVVDLDGAFAGRPVQSDLIASIIATADIPVQVGGGFRTIGDVRRALAAGATRVVLGTAAMTLAPQAAADFGDKIAVALDVKDGRIVTDGWTVQTAGDPVAVGGTLAAAGVRWFILTDVSRDGMMAGPNLDAVRAFHKQIRSSLIVAGGITTEDDLASVEGAGAAGAILGRALYEGRLDLQRVLARWGDGNAH